MNLIGLSGYAGSGKDAAASALLEDGWARVSFADVLREVAYAMDPYVDTGPNTLSPPNFERLSLIVDGYGWDFAKNMFPDVRRLLQRLGTEGGRDILGENIWVDTAFSRSAMHTHRIFTDVRFSNEADRILDGGGILVRIKRPGFGPVNSHSSDSSLDDYAFDYVIHNTGSLTELHQKMKEITNGRG